MNVVIRCAWCGTEKVIRSIDIARGRADSAPFLTVPEGSPLVLPFRKAEVTP